MSVKRVRELHGGARGGGKRMQITAGHLVARCPHCGSSRNSQNHDILTCQPDFQTAIANLRIEDGDVIFYDANLIERRAFAAVKNLHIITLVPVQPIIPHDPVANAVHKMSAKQLKALLEG